MLRVVLKMRLRHYLSTVSYFIAHLPNIDVTVFSSAEQHIIVLVVLKPRRTVNLLLMVQFYLDKLRLPDIEHVN